jgi:multiple sugar transport system permease protein
MTRIWSARGSLGRGLVLGIWSVIVGFPIYWLLITSIKPPLAISGGATYLPFVDFKPTLAAWQWIISADARGDVLKAFLNSSIAAGGSAVIATFLGALAAYGLTRFSYRFGPWRNDDIGFWFISQRMLPPVAVVLAFLIMFRDLQLLDTQLGLAIAYTGFSIPFAVWILKDTFASLPPELEDSAQVDGCTRMQAFTKIALPLAAPGLVASFLFCFVFSWNEYLFALMLTFQNATTVPLLLASRITTFGTEWDKLSALTLVNALPAAVMGVFLLRFLTYGLGGTTK